MLTKFYGVCGILAVTLIFLVSQTLQYQEIIDKSHAEQRLLQQRVKSLEQQLAKKPRAAKQPEAPVTIPARNKNPLNVKDLGREGPWRGQIGKDQQNHCIFESESWAVRAAALTLRTYYMVHKKDTVEKIIDRFCHTTPEHKAKYAEFVARRLGVAPDQQIDVLQYMSKLLKAMARYESGRELPDHLAAHYDILAKI